MSPQAYLDFEETSVERHEYVDGVIYTMPGETLRHNQDCRQGSTRHLLPRCAMDKGCRMSPLKVSSSGLPASTATIILT